MKIRTNKNIPDFFIVGAAKSGTTSLWYYLGQHSDIFMTKDMASKELGFFCNDYGINTLEKYASFFEEAKDTHIIGEACHSYLTSPESAKWIHKYNPQAKIIIILRNPIDRAYSLYNWMIAEGYEYANSFEKALALEDERMNKRKFRKSSHFPAYFRNYAYFNSGLYYEQIKGYLDIFGEEKCHILLFEEFKKDIDSSYKGILNFLDLNTEASFDKEPQNKSISVKYPALQYHLKHNVKRISKKFFVPKKLSNYLIINLKKWNISYIKPKKINITTAKMLQDRFKDDILKTGNLIKQDTSIWLKY